MTVTKKSTFLSSLKKRKNGRTNSNNSDGNGSVEEITKQRMFTPLPAGRYKKQESRHSSFKFKPKLNKSDRSNSQPDLLSGLSADQADDISTEDFDAMQSQMLQIQLNSVKNILNQLSDSILSEDND